MNSGPYWASRAFSKSPTQKQGTVVYFTVCSSIQNNLPSVEPLSKLTDKIQTPKMAAFQQLPA
jgi:hypothetical protein